jgi:Cys-rich repeat protein
MIGCPMSPTPTPPASAVLEGDWTTETEDGGVAFVRFDALGVVIGVFAVTAEGATVTVDIDDATTTLDGSAVILRIPTDAGEAVFEGTLSADQNTLTGTVTRSIVIDDDVLITIPAGDITLVRVECEADADCAEGEECENGVCTDAPVPECETDADCAEGQVCEDGVCVEAPEEPQHKTLFESLGEPDYQGTQTCLTCHSAHATDIMDSGHWNWSGAADNIAGLEGENHGKVDLINDY